MAPPLPERVDTCIIGNGPSALILSYILHGHIPYYVGRHQDDLLHSKLRGRRDLTGLSPDLYDHFQSSLRYSTQALPLNTLLDTLLRPNADTEVDPESLLEWRSDPRRSVSHVVLGDAARAGGQWVENPVEASWDIGTLSYAEMLSLPGYSFEEHYLRVRGGPMPELQRPTRNEVADYYASYPAAVGIAQATHASVPVETACRAGDGGFLVAAGSGSIRCKHLVLATGIFTSVLQPPPSLGRLSQLCRPDLPLLVVGSGFSAADTIISTPPHRRIVHAFKWDPEARPSPLKACHRQAYPEYAGIYRQMKLAALAAHGRRPSSTAVSPLYTRKRDPFFSQRDWGSVYEGLPNAQLLGAHMGTDGSATVQIRTADGEVVEREVGGLAYVVGRRGDLRYLDEELRREVLSDVAAGAGGAASEEAAGASISGKTLRARAEVDLEVAPDTFIIGSLTGDSLVRHAFGGCVYVAGRIMGCAKSTPASPAIRGVDAGTRPNGTTHEDLHLDRRKLAIS